MTHRNGFGWGLAMVLVLMSVSSQAQVGPSTTDLWDISQGSVVSNTTTMYPSSNADDMFGVVTNGAVEPGNALFQDGQSTGFVHSVEWSTPADVTVSSMVLSIAHDGPPSNATRRGISQFRLYAKNPQTGAFDILMAEYQPGNPYATGPQPPDGVAEFNQSGNEMYLCMNFSAVTAREFRAEFTQLGGTGIGGPRIFELDGYAKRNCGQLQINAGLNDAWFNPDTNGQGFFIIVFPDIPLMFLAWFTYDTERPDDSVQANLGDSGHRWITAQGPFEGNSALLDVVITRGGIFNSGEPEPENEIDGTMVVAFQDCETGTVTYDIESLGLQGVVPIQRIALDNVPLCEALAED